MCCGIVSKRSKEIRKYYLLLEELVQLYGAYTHQFKQLQLKVQLDQVEHQLHVKDELIHSKDEQIKANEDHYYIDDQKRESTQF